MNSMVYTQCMCCIGFAARRTHTMCVRALTIVQAAAAAMRSLLNKCAQTPHFSRFPPLKTRLSLFAAGIRVCVCLFAERGGKANAFYLCPFYVLHFNGNKRLAYFHIYSFERSHVRTQVACSCTHAAHARTFSSLGCKNIPIPAQTTHYAVPNAQRARRARRARRGSRMWQVCAKRYGRHTYEYSPRFLSRKRRTEAACRERVRFRINRAHRTRAASAAPGLSVYRFDLCAGAFIRFIHLYMYIIHIWHSKGIISWETLKGGCAWWRRVACSTWCSEIYV